MKGLSVLFGSTSLTNISHVALGRWHNHLNPDVKKGPWAEEEDLVILTVQREMGNCWAEMAKQLKGRTDNAIKNRWNATLKRKSQELYSGEGKTPDNAAEAAQGEAATASRKRKKTGDSEAIKGVDAGGGLTINEKGKTAVSRRGERAPWPNAQPPFQRPRRYMRSSLSAKSRF